MFSQLSVYFGIIVFPLMVYQIWAFRKPSARLPFATSIMGLYGGLGGILSHMFPLHIFGTITDVRSIPIILSILYGKHRSGVVSLILVLSYLFYAEHSVAWLSALSILLYSIPAFLVSRKFGDYGFMKKVTAATLLGLVVSLLQLAFICVYAVTVHPFHAVQLGSDDFRSLGTETVTQVLLMVPALLLLDHIRETGRVRQTVIRYQESLKESEERYRSLVEYNPDGICAMDTVGTLVYVNPAFADITGYDRDELLGMHRAHLWLEEDIEIALRAGELSMQGVNRRVETGLRHQSGRRIPTRIATVPMIVSNRVVGYYAIVTDIRQSKVAEELLRKTDKLATVGELAAGVAHEIRNPLTALKGFLKLLKAHDNTTERYVSIMESEIERIDFVSGQLLVFAKPQADQYRQCDLTEILQEVIDFLHPQASMADVSIIVDIRASIHDIVAEQNQIKQVLINVIKNSIEATHAGGEIHISTNDGEGKVNVVIRDTGLGMPRDVLKRLGEPFYTTKSNGTGLGLMVTHKIIERHGGKIHYDSAQGVGTTVTITLDNSPNQVTHDRLELFHD